MRRCVFLDRDGVINYPPSPGEYILRPRDLHIIPAVVDWIRIFNTLGLLVIVVTNQRCVARGQITDDELSQIHDAMLKRLREAGAHIDDVYVCPHEKDSCTCRKPMPGMVQAAAVKWDIDVSSSLMIGDSVSDRDLAAACGMAFVGVSSGRVVDTTFVSAVKEL